MRRFLLILPIAFIAAGCGASQGEMESTLKKLGMDCTITGEDAHIHYGTALCRDGDKCFSVKVGDSGDGVQVFDPKKVKCP